MIRKSELEQNWQLAVHLRRFIAENYFSSIILPLFVVLSLFLVNNSNTSQKYHKILLGKKKNCIIKVFYKFEIRNRESLYFNISI